MSSMGINVKKRDHKNYKEIIQMVWRKYNIHIKTNSSQTKVWFVLSQQQKSNSYITEYILLFVVIWICLYVF